MTEAEEVARAQSANGDVSVRRVGGLGGLDAVVRRRRAVQAERAAIAPNTGIVRRGLEGGSSDMQPLSIIVIDDEADQVDMTAMLLQTRGHRVIGTTDGLQAVNLVAGEGASVVVLDFMLGPMTGADVCNALRADPRTREVRIVLLSGTPELEIRRSCTQYDAFLRKPTTGDLLFKAVEFAAYP